MRMQFPLSVVGALLTLSALSGCGSGDNALVTAPVTQQPADSTQTRGDAPVDPVRVEYTVTDLGATEYYYSYYGFISNRYRYNGTLRLNDSGQIITNTASQPTIYDGQPRKLNNRFEASTVFGLNNAGDVVGGSGGYYWSYYYPSRATLWSGTAVDQIDVGSRWSTAYAINEQGAVVGIASQGDNSWDRMPAQAALWQNGTRTLLGTLGGNYSLAYGINNGGTIVGWSQLTVGTSYYDYNLPVHAFIWEQGTISDLGVLSGGTSSDAQDINDNGQIVGSADGNPQGLYSYRSLRAVTWINRAIQELGSLGGPGSIAYAINNSGTIVGSADTDTLAPQSPYYGWYWGGGGIGGGNNTGGTPGGGGIGGGTGGSNGGGSGSSDGTPPLAGGAGGRSVKPTRGIGDTYVSHAFRYQNGRMEDLNAYIPPDSGWELLTATDINRNGLIVGFGKFGNKQHAFLLTPK